PPDTAENAAAPLVEARAYAEHAYHAVEALFKKISEDIALKEKRNAGLLHNLLNEELRTYTETGKLPQEEDLLSRQNVAGLYVHEGGNVLLDEKEIGKIEKLIAGKSAFGSDILHGTTSMKGHARGAVRIIENPREAGIFNDGDILVTSMTNPDFLPLIKRAGAIVTEAGGVLSHAAIVSRELKKPCILNVKGALSHLKNGDNVEVDADGGTIRILDRME
ncbi:MAG: hypothetical protein JO026_02330, partial [Patescibacteria group bacterium]|nr:hypothetical protein [Patescibacteria group bacterium]